MSTRRWLVLCLSLVACQFAWAQPPGHFNYQGRLVDNGQLVNGPVSLTIRIYTNASIGTYLYEDTNTVLVTDGLYTTQVGDTTSAGSLANALSKSEAWLEVIVNGQPLSPRERLVSVPYAMMSAAVGAGAITESMIADGAVTAGKIATGAVDTVHIAAGAVTSNGLANSSVTAAAVAPGSISSNHMSNGSVGYQQLAFKYQSGSVILSNTNYFPNEKTTEVAFGKAFSQPPIVTATLRSADPTRLEDTAVRVTEQSTTGFTAQLGGVAAGSQTGPLTIDATRDSGRTPGITEVQYRPAVAYPLDATLMYARAKDIRGEEWSDSITVVTGVLPTSISMELVENRPAIVYQNGNKYTLCYAIATDIYGTKWASVSNVDTNGSVGVYNSFGIVKGRPAIAYYENNKGDLRFCRAVDYTGSGWNTPINVHTNGDVGIHCSMIIADGYPAIAYCYYTAGDLLYVRANNASGSAWGSPVTVVSGGTATDSSAALVNGRPAIAFRDGTLQLCYVRANDATGSTWGAPVTVDGSAGAGYFTRILVIDRKPVIVYYESTHGTLRAAFAKDAAGTQWGDPIEVDGDTATGWWPDIAIVGRNLAACYYDDARDDLKYVRTADMEPRTGFMEALPVATAGAVGEWCSLAVVDGNPAITFYDATKDDLCYVRATDPLGNSWGTPIGVDTNTDVGKYTSLAVVDGNPAIAYYNVTAKTLKYVRASDSTGSAWGSPVVLDAGGGNDVGLYASLAVIAGKPAVAYHDNTAYDLKFVCATDAQGSSWGSPVQVDIGGDVGEWCSLLSVQGHPAISYEDYTNLRLKYIRATNPTGTVWNTPVVVDSSYWVGKYTSLKIVNTRPAISYCDYNYGDPKYVRAADAAGVSWGTPVCIDTGGRTSGRYTSMTVFDGRPMVSYYDDDNGRLLAAHANDVNGRGWDVAREADNSSTLTGQHTSQALVGGVPAIAFYDSSRGDLMYIRWDTNTVSVNWVAVEP